jgi:hypothetical protein
MYFIKTSVDFNRFLGGFGAAQAQQKLGGSELLDFGREPAYSFISSPPHQNW